MIPRYGHRSFELDEILGGFSWLVEHTGQKVDRNALHIDPDRADELYDPSVWTIPEE